MRVSEHTRAALSLSELAGSIRGALNDAFPETCWVAAEIADCKANQRGHCYLDLVEKQEDRIVAQLKATIWAYEYRKLGHKFQAATGEPLRPGMKILLLASVSFHEVYGLSLNVKDLDPTYTLGEMARRKREIIERLRQEGIIESNRALPLPLVPQKIAVISSPTAAGYGDFFAQLDGNPYGYRFVHILFPALMQGQDAESSLIAALNNIKRRHHLFDAVVIIRGGGSAVDLSCFDSYPLAAQVARFPLPVITGIGHEKDDTVVDIVAHTRMKTPTAVAEFFISGMRSFEESVVALQHRLRSETERLLENAGHAVDSLARALLIVPVRLAADRTKVGLAQAELVARLRERLQREQGRVAAAEQAARLLDPAQVLRRGYSITRLRGRVLKNASEAKAGESITTSVYNGTITSIVGAARPVKEARRREQEQAAYLLPGFERAGTDNT